MSNNQTITRIRSLRRLETPSGLFLASAVDVDTGYNKAWLRDNFYTSLAFEAIDDWSTVRKLWHAVLDIFIKHESKINWAIEQKPHASWQYIHARYHPETFDEFWEEWGNKQNDAIGAILYKIGDLERMGQSVIRGLDDTRIIQKLIDYLNSIEYWHDPDSGIWEEDEEIHASSVGAVVAALRMSASIPGITVPEQMIERGMHALNAILPRESHRKFTDLALLSLVYPYRVVAPDMATRILDDIEYHLVKERGVIRYKTDRYYNKNSDGWSEEAEWTMGLSWLAIIFFERGDLKKAKRYFDAAKKTIISDKGIPELYFSNSNEPNGNTPLAWAESMFVVAAMMLAHANK